MSSSSAVEEGRNFVDSDDGETNKERREHLRHLQKEAFQLANYYFVFQSLIFTASYNAPSTLKCRYRWIPFALSLLAGFLNLCALSTIALKYKSTLDDIDIYCTGSARAQAGCDPNDRRVPIAVKCPRVWRLLYIVGCMALFVGFLVITLVGSWKITCGERRNSAAKPQSPTLLR